jgi:predicted amidophosphoribosyltransferase
MSSARTFCAGCGKPVTKRDRETGLVVYSPHTKRTWCPRCVRKSNRAERSARSAAEATRKLAAAGISAEVANDAFVSLMQRAGAAS